MSEIYGISKEIASNIKGKHSGLRQLLATESPLKIMKNAFLFLLKALLALNTFKILS